MIRIFGVAAAPCAPRPRPAGLGLAFTREPRAVSKSRPLPLFVDTAICPVLALPPPPPRGAPFEHLLKPPGWVKRRIKRVEYLGACHFARPPGHAKERASTLALSLTPCSTPSPVPLFYLPSAHLLATKNNTSAPSSSRCVQCAQCPAQRRPSIFWASESSVRAPASTRADHHQPRRSVIFDINPEFRVNGLHFAHQRTQSHV